ncbi:EF-P 5-aminopentanol modification-associated protein YfmH [Paenibacillus sp. y28]|uniref:EF-P 5-aminopentanol modification-associated protein YfmH n=1 Tax=Paenibacillus sp. y28 TaxID=3129110 RepID=UPI00301A04E4
MKAITNERLQETLYRERLDNGLEVILLPKHGFQKTYAVFTTRYGSVDNHFQVQEGAPHRVPDGIAHFLEHKMFEEPEGDIFAVFAAQGASANAYTSFDRTAYLFSATSRISQNVNTLLDFVQNPYFTDQNVEKEKGIIGQEINMYRDHPDWRVYYGLIEAMYASYPIRIDIAGTIESISHITKETLYACYHTFYHPSNMLLFVVGGIEPEAMMETIRANQAGKTFAPAPEISRIYPKEPPLVHKSMIEMNLPVSLPKCLFGFKEKAVHVKGEDLLKRELQTKLVLDMIFGSSSDLYQQLYDDQLITDGFGHEYNITENYAFSVIGGDTPDPDLLLERIRTAVYEFVNEGFKEEQFERARRKKIGGFLRMMNSPEAIAGEYSKYYLRGMDLFQILPLYESVTLGEVNARMREHFDWNQLAVSIVQSPK